ncbi:uncharacterized protein LOC134203345 [Armigeres subalbatus]|uniref:uncharacterized protein LOC134203345 n=1 Tax=Armigeres subalbatus TaxID=124917 RepID=UPI002ED5CA55
MKRKLNALELRRQLEKGRRHEDCDGEQHQQPKSPSKKRSPSKSTVGGGSPKRARVAKGYGSTSRKEDPREHQNLNRDEIVLMFMEVSEKIDRCFDFDLQKWLSRYEGLRAKEETNFPEAAMLITSAAQIYGRKVDYLEEIILHMDQDQKGRDENQEEQQKENKPTSGRKRAARFQPQSLSDCFGDLEFTVVNGKKAPIESLVTSLQRVAVDSRNKFQQMQELCNELRTMPSKQRKQEILNRLRDDANIPAIMSSHTAARKNQILDLESGETIGTRYDFQIHLNFIDVKTGLLMPEHDLKKFFQRCDVIDYLFEQHESESKRDGSSDQNAIFPLRPREFKIYLPPDYLKNKYRIEIDDTADFDNELHKARSSNYRKDPILELMQSKFAGRRECIEFSKTAETNTQEVSFSNALSSTVIEPGTDMDPMLRESVGVPLENSETHDDSQNTTPVDIASNLEDTPQEPNSTPFHDSGAFDDSQNTIPDESPSTLESTPRILNHESQSQTTIIVSIISEHDRNDFPRSKECSPEPELMALENQTTAVPNTDQDSSKQSNAPSRLSLEDEGIGVDRESLGKQTPSDLARSPSLDKLSDDGVGGASYAPMSAPMFGSGLVVMSGTGMRTISLKPALLERNLFKIPECHLRKHLLFTLPPEFKRLKMDLVRKASDRTKDIFTLTMYSLSPRGAKSPEWMRRASTPELEDFLGFDEFEDILQGPAGKCLYSLAPMSDGQQSNVSRASSPVSDFFGFDNDESIRGIASEEIARVADFDDDTGNNSKEVQATSCDPVQSEPILPEVVPEKTQQPEPETAIPQSESQQSTPTRTMSRDSGISDDQNEQSTMRQSRSKEATPEPSDETSDVIDHPQPEENPAVTSAKYIQSVAEAKELIEKVNSWHRKLKPILVQSEKRNHFDIHAYGTEIIDSFGCEQSVEDVPVINFAQVMENKPEDFTARYFLSMLMLANTNNVQIVARNQDSQRLTAKEDIELRLLSRKRHHQEMESMGERIPCDNTPTGRLASGGKKSKLSRGMKRKRLIEDDEGLEEEEDEVELRGIRRLQDDDDPDFDFLERIRRIYPNINSEESKRKRIAFHRGMRRCAYGLQDGGEQEIVPPQLPEPMEPTPEEDDPDEILSVNLTTNEAIMVMAPPPVMVDPDPCCSKSLVSTAESGYGSMIEQNDC